MGRKEFDQKIAEILGFKAKDRVLLTRMGLDPEGTEGTKHGQLL